METNSDTAATFVDQKLQIEEGAAAPGEPGEHRIPTGLLLVYYRG